MVVGEAALVAVEAAAALSGDSALISALLYTLALSSPLALASEGNLTVAEAAALRGTVDLGLLGNAIGTPSVANAPYAVRATVSTCGANAKRKTSTIKSKPRAPLSFATHNYCNNNQSQIL